MDAIDCTVEGDLELETDNDRKTFNKSRQNQRSYESSNSRSTRRSPPPPPPPSVNRKRPPSPVSSSSRSRNQHAPSSQKHHRNSSPSPPFIPSKYHRKSPSPPPPPPPPPSSSSRRHQSSRSTVPTKRPYSPADSSRDRRQPSSRSRTDFSSDNAFVSNSTSTDTRSIPKQNRNDLSYISDDESTKKPDIKNSTAIVQSSPIPTNHHRQPTPSLNESLLETSAIPGECELSLFAKSTISNSNTSVVMPPGNNFMQTFEMINKYKTISGNTTSNSNPQIEMWLKEIPEIIQRQIDLQKKELAVREREIQLREVEIAEKEKLFKNRSTDNTNNIEPIKVKINEDKTPVKLDNNIHHDIVNISPPEESVVKTIPSMAENSNSTTIPRKAGGKTRFSPIEIEALPPLSTDKPVVEHHPADLDVNQTTRKPSVQENLLTDEPILHSYSTELKVTSSSTSRKVEIQTGNHESTGTKSSAQDLRLTLSKNRSKYSSNDDNDQAAIEISPNSDEKQSSDYQSQRSITSTSIESNVDDQRDVHRRRPPQQQQQQSYHYNNQRSYNSGSSAKYGSKQKRGDNPRFFEQNNSKSSRSTYKTNH